MATKFYKKISGQWVLETDSPAKTYNNVTPNQYNIVTIGNPITHVSIEPIQNRGDNILDMTPVEDIQNEAGTAYSGATFATLISFFVNALVTGGKYTFNVDSDAQENDYTLIVEHNLGFTKEQSRWENITLSEDSEGDLDVLQNVTVQHIFIDGVCNSTKFYLSSAIIGTAYGSINYIN